MDPLRFTSALRTRLRQHTLLNAHRLPARIVVSPAPLPAIDVFVCRVLPLLPEVRQ